jgi:hypothetical protein
MPCWNPDLCKDWLIPVSLHWWHVLTYEFTHIYARNPCGPGPLQQPVPHALVLQEPCHAQPCCRNTAGCAVVVACRRTLAHLQQQHAMRSCGQGCWSWHVQA